MLVLCPIELGSQLSSDIYWETLAQGLEFLKPNPGSLFCSCPLVLLEAESLVAQASLKFTV